MCFCHFSHIKYKCIHKTWEKNFTGKSMILLGSAQIYWYLFHSQTWSNAEVAKSTCKLKSQEMQNEQVQIHWRSWWAQSTSCRQKKPALFQTTLDVLIRNSRQWDRICTPDKFVHAFCYNSFKLLSQENQSTWFIWSGRIWDSLF